MGLFDGYHNLQGSSAALASLLDLPVLLVVPARSTAYTVAATLYGFKYFRPEVKIEASSSIGSIPPPIMPPWNRHAGT